MTAATCKCGAELPDARAKFCPACRGARTKAQDNARKQAQLAELDGIDWTYVGIAVRMKLEEIRSNDKRVTVLVHEIAERQARAPASVIPHAAQGRPLRPENFRRVLAWLDRPAEDFRKSEALIAAAARLGGAA